VPPALGHGGCLEEAKSAKREGMVARGSHNELFSEGGANFFL